jgi:2-deoxy-scyllo-inosamine dehydrogenase (SAM-dependent)
MIKNLKVVEIEVNTQCNRKCSYCPVSKGVNRGLPKRMKWEIFQTVIAKLEEAEFDGRVSYHFYNEPLLLMDLEKYISYAKDKLKCAEHVIYSNGDLLCDERYNSLVESGVDKFIVTTHDNSVFPERPNQIVILGSDLNITNRGGFFSSHVSAIQKKCFVPLELIVIGYNGDVMLCYEDTERNNIFGNLVDSNLEDIYYSDEAKSIRISLLAGNRANGLSICKNCDNVSHIEPDTTYFST